VLRRLRGGDSGDGVVFSPDGRTLAVIDLDDRVSLWDVRTRKWLGAAIRADLPDTVAF
jgi:WD40 repeat protein